MYQRYKECHSASARNIEDDTSYTKDSADPVDAIVNICWKQIEQQIQQTQQGHVDDTIPGVKSLWKNVYIFVSSTFSDFHNEREILVKKVFPELKDWCHQRHIHLVECDLRWGIEGESTTQTTIGTCMEEIDRSIQESGGKPYFINLCGNRYGWIPNKKDISEEIRQKYLWVDNVSITHMEILHGAYRSKSPNAVFFMRDDSSFIQDIPSDHLNKFTDKDALSITHLQALKSQIRKRFSDSVYDYSCRYIGIDDRTGRPKVKLRGLENMAEQCISFFKRAITTQYGDSETMENEDSLEDSIHSVTMEVKTQFVFGRDAETQQILDYARGEYTSLHQMTFADEEAESIEKDFNMATRTLDLEDMELTSPLLVSAEPGYGKSAVLALAAKLALQEDLNVLYHCVGASSDSMTSAGITTRITKRLMKDTSDQDKIQTKNSEDIQVLDLNKVFKTQRDSKQLLVILDGVDEIHGADAAFQNLQWIPAGLPGCIRLVLSCSSTHAPTMALLKTRKPYHLVLGQLDRTASQQIVQHTFGVYGKKLDIHQMDTLLNHESVGCPLWLSTACEELRVFGDFVTLSSKISSLPGTVVGLHITVINRLIQEDDTGVVKEFLCLLYCATGGLPEPEIRHILGSQSEDNIISMVTWTTVQRYTKSYLRRTKNWRSGETRIRLNHSTVYQAIKESILTDGDDEKRCHIKLADYYDKLSKEEYMLEDYPYHVSQAGLGSRLQTFIRKDRRSVKLGSFQLSRFINSVRCNRMQSMAPMEQPFIMCKFCAQNFNILRPFGFKTSDCCVLCGNHIPTKQFSNPAGFCSLHKQRMGGSMEKCDLCGLMAMGHRGPGVKGQTCNWCSGAFRNKCCFLVG